MLHRQFESVQYYTFDSFDEAGVTHAVFTRQGGVSPYPWATLNMGGTVGDDAARVAENRQRAFKAIGRHPETIFDVWQVHGADVVLAKSPRPSNLPHQKADVILTDQPQITIFMRFADCVPILLFDPNKHVVGMVHAGWQGTVKRAAYCAVETMKEAYRSQPSDILAAIGPSIGPHHYQVQEDVVRQVKEVFGQDSSALLSNQNGKVHFNLWEANRLLLVSAGVQQIEISKICTACNTEEWFSHRGDKGKTGRFGVLIGLTG